MKKNEFVNAIAVKAGGTKSDALVYLDAIGEVTLEAIAKNDCVPFMFGKIEGVDKPAHVGRNPKTGETVDVPAKSGCPKCKFNRAAKA